ncbi:MAG: hypothetical protein ACYTGR_08860 [Planctomycetota bacterium]
MAFFKKKGGGNEGDGKGPVEFVPQPEKARKWFQHAQTAADSTNFDYALSCYASGLKLDPETMSAHEAMYQVSLKYAGSDGKPASGKETRSIDDGTPVGKFVAAEFAWMKDINNAALANKAIEAAIKAEQLQWGNWAAGRALVLMRRGKKPTKSQLMSARDLFRQVEAWNEAIAAGELALQLDPSDNDLQAELKDLAAQRAMDQGGYNEAAGQEGGYRKFIRDADKQRELEEAESISGTASVEERNLLRAKAAYEETPDVPDVLNQYAQLLKKQGTDEALQQAYRVYMRGFEAVGEYRFRASAGDIKIERAKTALKELIEQAANNNSGGLDDEIEAGKTALLDLEAEEYRERVQKYPTNRPLRFQLGVTELRLGNLDSAMECFQKAKDEPKLRVRAGHMLGKCFAREGWHSEAIEEYQEALRSADVLEEEREQDIRYDLMLSLIEHARSESSGDLAREARDICSQIARKDISYRDIRVRRKEVDELVKTLG